MLHWLLSVTVSETTFWPALKETEPGLPDAEEPGLPPPNDHAYEEIGPGMGEPLMEFVPVKTDTNGGWHPVKPLLEEMIGFGALDTLMVPPDAAVATAVQPVTGSSTVTTGIKLPEKP